MTIFVTGAAGLLGGAPIAALTEAGHSIVGLVHNEATIRDNAGSALAAPHCDPTSQPPRLCVVHGDVTRPGLGLDAATRDWLEQHVTLVIHCAALVRFDAAWDDLAAVNIGGTRHVAQ